MYRRRSIGELENRPVIKWSWPFQMSEDLSFKNRLTTLDHFTWIKNWHVKWYGLVLPTDLYSTLTQTESEKIWFFPFLQISTLYVSMCNYANVTLMNYYVGAVSFYRSPRPSSQAYTAGDTFPALLAPLDLRVLFWSYTNEPRAPDEKTDQAYLHNKLTIQKPDLSRSWMVDSSWNLASNYSKNQVYLSVFGMVYQHRTFYIWKESQNIFLLYNISSLAGKSLVWFLND